MTPPHFIDSNSAAATSLIPSPEITPKQSTSSDDAIDTTPDATSQRHLLNDIDMKAEIDTGEVSEQWFSFKKLWTYAGPGKGFNLKYIVVLSPLPFSFCW